MGMRFLELVLHQRLWHIALYYVDGGEETSVIAQVVRQHLVIFYLKVSQHVV
jgi:hypothetical protein